MVVGANKERVLAERDRGNYACGTAHPHRLLSAQSARKLNRLFESPGGNQGGDFSWSNVGDKLLALELRLEKIFPVCRDFFRREKLLIEYDDLQRAGRSNDIAVCCICDLFT